MTARRRLLRLAPLVLAGCALGITIPRAVLVAHVHAGGDRAHVHLGADRHGHGDAHGHASPRHGHVHADGGHGHHHEHPHAHGHPHDHGHDEPIALALVVPTHAPHVHWQAPFQRAVPAALPPAVLLATAGPLPATTTPPGLERPQPSSRSRGPPRA